MATAAGGRGSTAPPERRFSEDAADLAASIGSVRTRSLSPLPKGWKSRLGLGGVARRTLGFGLLMVTVCLWTLSNFLASVSMQQQLVDHVTDIRSSSSPTTPTTSPSSSSTSTPPSSP